MALPTSLASAGVPSERLPDGPVAGRQHGRVPLTRHRLRWLPIFVIGSAATIVVLLALMPGLGLLTSDTSERQPTFRPGSTESGDAAGSTVAGSPAWEAQVVAAVNRVRKEAGLRKVRPCPTLRAAAQAYAERMAAEDFFSHVPPEGIELGQRLRDAGVKGRRMWENIAAGETTAEGVMRMWLESPLHKQNILEPKARRIGVGVALNPDSTYGTYWVQDFGVKKSCKPG